MRSLACRVGGGAFRRCFGSAASQKPLVRPMAQPTLASALRRCSTVPTEEEVIRAYNVLGVSTAVGFADVKKRYVSLAKEHHPDIAAGTGSSSSTGDRTSKMVDINNAYNTVNRFHKAGRRLSPPNHAAGAGGSHSGAGGHSATGDAHWRAGQHQQQRPQGYYTAHDRGYQPWHEDLDPLLYEMMWEELRRQNDHDAFERATHPDEFYDSAEEGVPPSAAGSYRPPRQQRGKQTRSEANRSGNEKATQKEKVKSTTWPDTDVEAMANMYQDGKSFEFIANALGKEVPKVVAEFNRWSDDNKRNRRSRHGGGQSGQRRNGKWRGAVHHRGAHGPGKGAYYHMEYPTGPPYGFYDYMVDEDDFGEDDEGDGSDPYGYYVGDDFGYHDDPWEAGDGGPTPFNGTHHMSGGGPRTPHTHRGAAASRFSGGPPGGHRKRDRFFKNSNNRNHKNRSKKP